MVIIVFERPAIVPHGHAGLLYGGEVFLGLFFDNHTQVFLLGVGEICHICLFANGNPGSRVCDQCLPVDVSEEGMLFELLDAVCRPKSLLGVPHQQLLEEIECDWVDLVIVFTGLGPLNLFVQYVRKY